MIAEPERGVIELREAVARVRAEVGKVIVGNEEILDGLLTCLLVEGHALLEGIPGLGKTRLVHTLAAALHLDFSRIQFTPDLMPADIVGTDVVQEDASGHRTLTFRPGPLFAHVVLADEINRATPKTQSALLEAMQEKTVSVGRTTYPLEDPFFVLATQNPLEMEGTFPLPEAQLDRFLLKLRVRYPSAEELHEILRRTTEGVEQQVTAVLDREGVLELRRLVRSLPIAHAVRDYAVRVVLATHPDRPGAPARVARYVRYGASPRGAQAMLLAAKVRALCADRPNVAAEDLRAVAKPALRHRVLLGFEGEAEGIDTDSLLDDVISSVPLP
jgi:MoxR-like ATPase